MTKTEMLMAKSMGAGRSLRKQKKMNDVIRREDAFNYFVALWECIGTIMDKNEWEDVCMTTANEIPPAQPEIKIDGDTISRQAAIECLEHLSACDEPFVEIGTDDETFIRKYEAITEISDLPPAQTERETAKFIRWMECKKTADYISYTPHCKCSKCGTEFLIETIKYCYMCGARMER